MVWQSLPILFHMQRCNYFSKLPHKIYIYIFLINQKSFQDHYDNTTTSTEEEEEPPNSIELKPTPTIKATIITVTAKGGGRKGRNSNEERKDEEELEETGVTGDDLDDILAGDLTEQEDEWVTNFMIKIADFC